MMKVLQYPQTDRSEKLRRSILTLQNTAWPSTSVNESLLWPGTLHYHKTSFVLIHEDILVSHVAVVGKDIIHEGIVYRAFGLSEVVTHPSYQKRGYGLELIKQAFRYIEGNDPDISVFTCNPSLVNFYTKGGWTHIKDTCVVGGSIDNPFRSDSLGLATMMCFHSRMAKDNQVNFLNSDIYLEIEDM